MKSGILKKIGIGAALVVGGFVVVVAMQPAEFSLERKTTIAAPADVVFAQINDFHAWQAWSPWDKLDLSMQKKYEGAASGNGASYFWSGNDKVGEGRMTITESVPSKKVAVKLEFLKPWQATNDTTFTLEPQGAATSVAWRMSGTRNFMMKAMGLFMSMEKMVGPDFERGLAEMKKVSEEAAKKKMDDAAKTTITSAPIPATP